MGREVRKVIAGWGHPKDNSGQFIPLLDGYNDEIEGFRGKIVESGLVSAIEYYGGGPLQDDYTPDWPKEARTHFMMYETCSKGTPLSPAMETPEELARWLADNGASSFGNMTATYEQWLIVCLGDSAPSAVVKDGVLQSGVEALADLK